MKINKYIMKNNSCAKMEKLDYIHLLIFSILFRYVFSEFSVYFFPKDSAACVSKKFDARRNIKGRNINIINVGVREYMNVSI